MQGRRLRDGMRFHSMANAALVLLVALLATGTQAAMTSVDPMASTVKANQRSTRAAAGEDETHLLVYKVSGWAAHVSCGHQELQHSRAMPLICSALQW